MFHGCHRSGRKCIMLSRKRYVLIVACGDRLSCLWTASEFRMLRPAYGIQASEIRSGNEETSIHIVNSCRSLLREFEDLASPSFLRPCTLSHNSAARRTSRTFAPRILRHLLILIPQQPSQWHQRVSNSSCPPSRSTEPSLKALIEKRAWMVSGHFSLYIMTSRAGTAARKCCNQKS